MRKRVFAAAVLILFSVSWMLGCGKKKEQIPVTRSVVSANYTFTDQGLFCRDNGSGRLEYFDYDLRDYFPVCSRPNCRHDTEECTAVALNKKLVCVGQQGEKLYYLQIRDIGDGVFCSCGLDGENSQELVDFPAMPNNSYGGVVLFQDNKCFLAAGYDLFDEETYEFLGVTSAVYQVDLKGGTWTELLPERKELCPAYEIYGLYEDRLLFSEWDGDSSDLKLKVLDLETGEVSMPFGEVSVLGKSDLEGEWFFCTITEAGSERVKKFNLETGETAEIAQMELWDLYVEKELKILIDTDGQTWQYTDGGELKLIREEKELMILYGGKGELLVGTRDYQDLVYMEKEDFLAGKDNWTVVREAGGQ